MWTIGRSVQPDGPHARLVHVARQPLYDRAGAIVGYELLFRGGADHVEATSRNAYATSNVIVSAFTDVGLTDLVGDRLCFVNLTGEFLVGALGLPFPPGQAVLEVLETVPVDDRVVAGVTELVGRGYAVALDDFVWGSGHERLLPLATYVKLEVAGTEPGELAEAVARCRRYPSLQLVAERLETPQDHRRALDLGFDLFQGYVLARPQVATTVGLSPTRLHRVRLLATLAEPAVDVRSVASVVRRDPALSYRLLRATNSAASGVAGKVSSVHEAIVLLGLRRVREWVTLMLMGDLADANEELATAALVRAGLCRNVAKHLALSADAAFTVGLLSGVAELVGEPVAEVASRLPLTDDVALALNAGHGPLGAVLNAVRQYENADLDALRRGAIPTEVLVSAYLRAVQWAERSLHVAIPNRASARST